MVNKIRDDWTLSISVSTVKLKHVPTHPIPFPWPFSERARRNMHRKERSHFPDGNSACLTSHFTSSGAAAVVAADVFCIFTHIQLNKTTEIKTLCSVSQQCSHSHITRA